MNLAPPVVPQSTGPGFMESTAWGPVVVRVLLFLVFVVGFSATLGTVAALTGLIDRSAGLSPTNLLVSEFTKAVGTLLAAWLMSRLEGRRRGEYGLPWRAGQAKLFAQGAVFGIAEIAAIVGALAATGYYSFGSLEIHGALLVKWALFWAIVFVIVGFFEEYAFRGYTQFA